MNIRNFGLLALVLAFLFSAAGVQTPAHAAVTPVTARVTVYRLSMRVDAGVRAARLAVLKQNDILTVLGQKKVGRVVWYKVQTASNQSGWVISTYIAAKSGSLKGVPAA